MRLSRFTSVAIVIGGIFATLANGQARSPRPSIVGTWRLVHIESSGPDAKHPETAQPAGMLIYTRDGHASVQLMYPQTSLSDEFVHDGYEATFGTYELNEPKHQFVYHILGSATRDKLIGKSETLQYDLPDNRHMIIRPTHADQHWSVTWERY